MLLLLLLFIHSRKKKKKYLFDLGLNIAISMYKALAMVMAYVSSCLKVLKYLLYIYCFSWCFYGCYCSSIRGRKEKIFSCSMFEYDYLFVHSSGYGYGLCYITFINCIMSVCWLELTSTGKYKHTVLGNHAGISLYSPPLIKVQTNYP